jgi:hypothetical protein
MRIVRVFVRILPIWYCTRQAYSRRAQAFESLDRLEDAVADLDAILKIDPTVAPAREKHARLSAIVLERQEKLKAEMMGASHVPWSR